MVRHTVAQTMTDFLARYEYDTSYMYSYNRYTDPPSDWALFTLKDSLVAWRSLRLLRSNMAMIRSCVRWSPDGQVEIPLTHAEVPLASSDGARCPIISELWAKPDGLAGGRS